MAGKSNGTFLRGEPLDELAREVADYAVAEGLLRHGDRVLAAVSGGADSLALLHILWSVRQDLGLDLAVASLDHGLRGAASAADLAFVREVAGRLGLPFHGERADPASLPSRGLSPEEAARRLRYDFLGKVARRWGPGPAGPVRVATGHTATDQAETVLMRVIEGTGLGGLAGMPPVREEDGWLLVRPLLRVSRAETWAYCLRHHLEPREDRTNVDPRFRRNLVRLRVMPALRECNPKAEEALVRLADLARQEVTVLEALTERLLAELASRGVPDGERPFGDLEVAGPVVALDKVGFARLPGPVRARLLRRVVSELAGEEVLRDLGYEGAARAVTTGTALGVGRRVELPGRVVLEAGYRFLFLAVARRRLLVAPARPSFRFPLRVPGTTELADLGWVFEVSEVAPGIEHPGQPPAGRLPSGPRRRDEVWEVDAGKVSLPLAVRTRKPGDRFWPTGLGAAKKLKDFFIAAKVPRAQRDSWPLVVDAEDRIVWVAALRGDDRFAPGGGPGAGPVLRLVARRRATGG